MGFLSLYYMTPAFRFRGLGVQLLGQAVSFYRGLGRTSLRLRCAPDGAARQFYEKHGFLKSAEGQIGPLSWTCWRSTSAMTADYGGIF